MFVEPHPMPKCAIGQGQELVDKDLFMDGDGTFNDPTRESKDSETQLLR